MTKTVVPNHEVAHLWAHQAQETARSGNGNISFRGTNLYSYRALIGRLVTNARGEPAAVLSTRNHSVTTTSHQSSARSATNHLVQLYVEDIGASPESQREWFAERITQAEIDYRQARDVRARAKALDGWSGAVQSANRYCRFFGLPEFTSPPHDEAVEAYRDRQRVRREIRDRARSEQWARDAEIRRKSDQERLAAWLAGETNATPSSLPLAYLRLSRDGQTVETSKGARVPVDHLRKVAPLVLRLIASGGTYRRNGHSIHLGPYTLDSIDESGTVRAGCHTFDRAEIERFASVLGIASD
jgi:hypothetical protein